MDDSDYIPGLDPEPEAPQRPGLPVEPRRLLRCVLAQRKRLLQVALLGAVLGAIGIWLLPQQFESSARLLFEGAPVLDADAKNIDPRAFIESATTDDQLRKLRRRLKWDSSLEDLQKQLLVTAHIEDGSMTVEGWAHAPEDAQRLVHGLVELFLEQQTAFNAERFEKAIQDTSASLKSAKEQHTQAEKAYRAFQKKVGKSNVLKEQEQLLARVSKLREQAAEQAVEVDAQTARIAELEKARANLPAQIVASAVSGSVVDRALLEARAELAAAKASLSSEHPKVRALEQRVKGLEAQRKTAGRDPGQRTMAANPALAEVEKQLATARAALAAAKEKEQSLRALSQKIKTEAFELAPAEGEARKVLGNLELTQDRVDRLTERSARLNDAARSPTSGFRVVAPATLPETADRSGVQITLLAMLPLFFAFIAALVFIGFELRDLDLQAPREVAWWGEGPVLGTSVWPRRARALDEFVDEMEDHGVHGFGRTLVIPATEAERDIACTLAMRLAEAPWLAAAILDVQENALGRGRRRRLRAPDEGKLTTPVPAAVRRLGPDASPAPRSGDSAHTERASDAGGPKNWSSGRVRRPTSETVFGMPAVKVASDEPTPESPNGSASPDDSAAEQVEQTEPGTESTPSGAAPVARGNTKGKRDKRSKRTRRGKGPARRKTMVGVPVVAGPSSSPPASSESGDVPIPLGRPAPVSPRISRATVRMVVPSSKHSNAEQAEERENEANDEEAFLLTRPAVVAGDHPKSGSPGQAVLVDDGAVDVPVSQAVMRAAVRLLSDDDEPSRPIRPSSPPRHPHYGGEVTAVALAWNGPLSGPVLRRAARLAHRVMVVVSAGVKAPTLAGIKTRIGRSEGVGYVLVNLADEFVDLEDRVGPVESFWEGDK